ncbi:MAG: helix-turn-helix domain-containing protein [Anaerolineales bacterium]|nr:helix-turn-helix domain-containing protein [Anaerolineales bacterium]
MDRRYKHLNSEERGVIFAEHRRGSSLRTIGLQLGRSASTIGREIVRGRGADGGYNPLVGRQSYDARRTGSRRPCRLIKGSALLTWVHGKLVHLGWSPEQIAGKSLVNKVSFVRIAPFLPKNAAP